MKIGSHSVSCRFVPWTVSFDLQKVFSFVRSYLPVDLSACVISVLFRRLSLVPMYSRPLLIISSIRFGSSHFVLRSLIHLEFYTGQWIWICLPSSTCRHPVRAASCIEGAFFSPMCISGFLLKNWVSVGVWIYVWVFHSSPLINVFACMSKP